MKAKGFTFDQAMSEIGGTRIGSPSTISHLVDTPEAPKEMSYIDRVLDTNSTLLANRAKEFQGTADRMGRGQGKIESAVQGVGTALATGILDPVNSIVTNIPGVKPAMSAIGKGVEALSKTAPIKFLGNLIGNNERVAEAVKLYDTDPQFKQTVNSATNIVTSALTAKGLIEGGTALTNKTIKGGAAIKDKAGSLVDSAAKKYATTPQEISKNLGIKVKSGDTSASIMNRIARVNPKDAETFAKYSGGKTIGEYLAETGNTNAPKKLIEIETKKFFDSMKSVDDAFEEIDANTGQIYADGSIDDVIAGLQEKAKAVSSKNVPAPFQGDLTRITESYATNGGLSMQEINALKRLYERNVKLGYSKLLNPDGVAQATNLDNALRQFQFKQAKAQGFSNIDDLNRQTQMSKLIVDKLGNKLVDETMLNANSLTDWLILSNVSPEAIAGFITKKFFGSKGVQAKIAEMLNQTDSVEMVKPNYAQSIPIRDANAPIPLALPEGKIKLPSQGILEGQQKLRELP